MWTLEATLGVAFLQPAHCQWARSLRRGMLPVCRRVLPPLQPTACPLYGLVPGVRPGKNMRLYVLGDYLGRHFRKVSQPYYVEGTLLT